MLQCVALPSSSSSDAVDKEFRYAECRSHVPDAWSGGLVCYLDRNGGDADSNLLVLYDGRYVVDGNTCDHQATGPRLVMKRVDIEVLVNKS